MKTLSVLLAVSMFAFGSLANGQSSTKVTLPAFGDGGHVHGPKITPATLKGKVIFFEYWGVRCPPCLASMPHLQELQKKFGKTNYFTVIGSESQRSTDEAIMGIVKQNRITFPIYKGAAIKEATCPGGIPYAVLIGANGRVVAKGSPDQLYGKVGAEVAKARAGISIVDGMTLTKYKSLEKALVPGGKGIDAKVEPLRKLANDEEAQNICAAYDAWLTDQKAIITELMKNDPIEAAGTMIRLKTAVPTVTDFDADLERLKSNKDLPNLAKLQRKVEDLEEKVSNGKKLKEPDVASLLKELDKFKSTDESTITVVGKIRAALKDLESTIETKDKK